MKECKLDDLLVVEHFPFCSADNIHIHHVLMRQQEGVARNEEDETSDKRVDAKSG